MRTDKAFKLKLDDIRLEVQQSPTIPYLKKVGFKCNYELKFKYEEDESKWSKKINNTNQKRK